MSEQELIQTKHTGTRLRPASFIEAVVLSFVLACISFIAGYVVLCSITTYVLGFGLGLLIGWLLSLALAIWVFVAVYRKLRQ